MSNNLYRKKSVIITAEQWFENGDHSEDYSHDTQGFEDGELQTFTGAERKAKHREGAVVRYFRRPDVSGTTICRVGGCNASMQMHGWIDTLEGGHIVCPGDWIIKGIKGEFYPCKDEIFRLTYEPVEG